MNKQNALKLNYLNTYLNKWVIYKHFLNFLANVLFLFEQRILTLP